MAGAHGIDHECRPRCVECLFQFLGYHAPHDVALHQSRVQVLQVSQSHVRVVGLVAHIEYGGLSRFMLQVVGTEVDTMVVAVGSAMGNESPSVVVVEIIEWCKILDDLAFEHLR